MTQLFSYLGVATAIEVRVSQHGWPIFWRQIKSLKKQNAPTFLFVMFLPNYKSLSWTMNTFSSKKRFPTSMTFWHQADWLTNLPPFQGARPDHVRGESSSSCFPRALVSFVRPSGVSEFWHVLLPSENVFEFGGITAYHDIARDSKTISISYNVAQRSTT